MTCNFCEYNQSGKLVQKATQAKIARGEMVRFMAQNHVLKVEQLKEFKRLGYLFEEALSDEELFVFVKKSAAKKNSIGYLYFLGQIFCPFVIFFLMYLL